ncbi:TonB-dependent receptor plug domain-containing protein [Phocaeicola sp.]
MMNNSDNTKIYFTIILLFCSISIYGQDKTISNDTLRSLRLQEVVVTATQPDAPGSHSVIGQDAIRHIQATDLSGLSQLLPGVLTHNPNLNAPASFTIRSATYDNATNALGTAILIDGIRMNNNANMQQMGLGGQGNLFNSSALSGFDVRSLSPASIESVEVIRGVPSARYGDVTSGVVLVQSKAGLQPYTVGLRFTATEKLASAGKGFQVGNNGGTLYLGADYARSTQAPALPEESFHRFGVQASYAKDFTAATLRLNLRGYWMKDNDKRGNNTVEGEYQKYLNRGISFSANGQWKLMKPWISNLEYQVGLTYSHQENKSNTYYSGTQQVTTYTTQGGEHEGVFLPPNYFALLSVEGKPIHVNASLTGNLRKGFGEAVFNHAMLGIEGDMEGNQGKGIEFDPSRAPINMPGIRTRSYRSIPFIYRYTAFAENKLTVLTGKMRTELQAGIRVTKQHTSALHYRPAADPRINLRQVLIDQNEDGLLNHLSLRMGWGLMHKMPVLAYLYPDLSYTDKNCFTYNDTENGHRLTVMHTFATDRTFNPDLRLPVNRKLEFGINLQIAHVKADVVWFQEHLKNGFCTSQEAESFTYRKYDALTCKGEHPALTADGVMNNGAVLPYTSHTTFATYARAGNGIEQKKQGVEYTIGPIRSERLHSSLLISGSYLDVCEKNTSLSAIHPQIEVGGKAYPYVGIYESDTFGSNLQVWQQFNTRFQCITQLPRIGLVTSLTLQAVWMDKQRRGMESRYNNPVYLADENGNRIEGNPMTDTEHQKCLNPVYYLDADGNRHTFTPEMATDKQFSDLVLRSNTLTAFQTDSYSPYFLLNLRVTKEIGRRVSVAFCANNLTQSNPKRYSRSTRQYSILNPNLYYGAEVSIRF